MQSLANLEVLVADLLNVVAAAANLLMLLCTNAYLSCHIPAVLSSCC
jgi:hypothetical protein